MMKAGKAPPTLLFLIILALFSLTTCSGGSGAGQFDNARAGRAIMDSIKADQALFLKSTGKAIEYTQREGTTAPQQYKAFCQGSKEQQDGLVKLEEKGLLKVYADQQSGCSYVTFSEKATPYLKKQEKSTIVFLATVDRVEVTDLGTGKQTRTVKYKAYYSTTPFGETLLNPQNMVEEKEAGFTLSFDEGWRIN